MAIGWQIAAAQLAQAAAHTLYAPSKRWTKSPMERLVIWLESARDIEAAAWYV